MKSKLTRLIAFLRSRAAETSNPRARIETRRLLASALRIHAALKGRP